MRKYQLKMDHKFIFFLFIILLEFCYRFTFQVRELKIAMFQIMHNLK